MKIVKFSLAPIHEYTDAAFRILSERHKCKMTFVPLVNVTSVTRGFMPFISEIEKNVSVQLSGSKPQEFKEAIKIIEKKYPFIKGFNINAGCPSPTTMKVGAGGALMKNPENLCKIIEVCKDSTSYPLSVKIRIFENIEDSIKLYKKIESCGADFIIIHGRTIKQGYSGNANWEIIKKANDELNIPVIGNGDIRSLNEGMEKIKNGYCKGVMIGRAALQNPRIFEGKEELNKTERIKLAEEYYRICKEIGKEDLTNIKLIYSQLFKSIKHAAKLRNKIMSIKDTKEIEDIIGKIE